MIRPNLYKDIHKLVRKHLFSFSEDCAKVDFTSDNEVQEYQQKFEGWAEFLEMHALNENMGLHPLLVNKNADISRVTHDHEELEGEVAKLRDQVVAIAGSTSDDEKIALAHEHYLDLQMYIYHQLGHLNEEERVIMPLLQSLYTDEELEGVIQAIFTHMDDTHFIHAMLGMVDACNLHEVEDMVSNTKKYKPQSLDNLLTSIRPMVGDETADLWVAKYQQASEEASEEAS